jgi:hypothetical protein
MSVESVGRTHYGQRVIDDEDGDVYYVVGHVPPRRAVATANRYARVECGLRNLYDDPEVPGLPSVAHSWFRPDPEDPDYPDSERWNWCQASDEGARPFTVVTL